jgi:hypothetical protein
MKQVNIVVGGGVTIPSSMSAQRRCLSDLDHKATDDPIVYSIRALKGSNHKWTLSRSPMRLLPDDENDLSNIGPLVHHGCVVIPVAATPNQRDETLKFGVSCRTGQRISDTIIPNRITVAMVGGGVIGFSFGPCYAKSFMMRWIDQMMSGIQAIVEKEEDKCHEKVIEQVANPIQKSGHPTKKHSIPITRQNQTIPSTDVLYVKALHAKQLKIALEKLNLISKRFRMTKVAAEECYNDHSTQWFHTGVNDSHLIAVPVTRTCIDHVRYQSTRIESTHNEINIPGDEWPHWIIGMGKHQLPLSSGAFARKHTSPYQNSM